MIVAVTGHCWLWCRWSGVSFAFEIVQVLSKQLWGEWRCERCHVKWCAE